MKHDFSDFTPGKKRNKMGNKRTLYNGIWYQSGMEAKYREQLDQLEMLPEEDLRRPETIINQFPYPVTINGKVVFTYYADFLLLYRDGRAEVVDVKGFKTDVYKIKKKCVEAFYGIKIKEVKI